MVTGCGSPPPTCVLSVTPWVYFAVVLPTALLSHCVSAAILLGTLGSFFFARAIHWAAFASLAFSVSPLPLHPLPSYLVIALPCDLFSAAGGLPVKPSTVRPSFHRRSLPISSLAF
jgi:hypothetical protein